ncbi:MAG: 2-phospho-L-lactate transferase [Anaerolinea sp.]|nr:2-phospho-L-lactate transferase [Anaerolinea sp.]
MTKVLALAGGVGGAKLVYGLTKTIPAEELTVIVNTGDDFINFGLNISPDLDTVMYNLAEISNEATGWGRKDETWNCAAELKKIGSETWFNLGDRDLATHLERTRLLKSGLNLTDVTAILCKKFGVSVAIKPMTDESVHTIVTTDEYGDLPFQEYFVKYHFEPKYITHRFFGIYTAKINPETRKAIQAADIIIICPSNPWLSILPILAVEDMRKLISKKICVAVSPIVGNEAIKGPAAKMFHEMNITPSAYEVAKIYKGVIDGFVLDNLNSSECDLISACGIIPMLTDTIMKDKYSKERLAKEIFDFASQLKKGN